MYTIGIDASRNRSGGAKAHIIGIINSIDINKFDIETIHIWTYTALASLLPQKKWLKVHLPKELNENLLFQLAWQKYKLPHELLNNNIDILLSTDAGTVCSFEPNIVMSRDMLSFEPGEMSRYFPSKSWLRLMALKYVQLSSIKKSTASIFLTKYARDTILKSKKNKYKIIPHGISDNFRSSPKQISNTDSLKYIYVANADRYKHQLKLISGFSTFLIDNQNATLTLVGAKSGEYSTKIECYINENKKLKDKIKVLEFLPHNEIPSLLKQHDVFIFASSCENMPNTLIEAMAMGLPILSSNRGPMPEILSGSGILFDPENVESITTALYESLNTKLMNRLSIKSKEISDRFSWSRCADETFDYLIKVKKDLGG